MQQNEIYVYAVKNGKVVQEIWGCREKNSGHYEIKIPKKQYQTVYKSSLDKCERNRVVSFTDDLPRFRQMIIDDMEARIEVTTQRLAQQVSILESVKKN